MTAGADNAVEGMAGGDDRIAVAADITGRRDAAGGAAGGKVVKLEPVRLPGPAASEAAALISMIERAAADPSVDIDRIERMYAMYERATARSAKTAFLEAVQKARKALPAIVKRGTIETNASKTDKARVKQSTYAKWDDVVEAILPVLDANDLVLTFRTSQDSLDRVSVTAVLSHVDGHSEQSQMALPIENGGSKNNAQGWGSSVSYGKRYTAFALLNLVGKDEDNDAAGPPVEPISQEQEDTIREALEANGKNAANFCKYFKLEKIGDLKASDYDRAIGAIVGRRTNG